jgi:hypothetical protein
MQAALGLWASAGHRMLPENLSLAGNDCFDAYQMGLFGAGWRDENQRRSYGALAGTKRLLGPWLT